MLNSFENMRNFKPDPENPGITKEKFTRGIDPGLRQWLITRKEARNAKNQGSAIMYPICSSQYKFHSYWKENLICNLNIKSEIEINKNENNVDKIDNNVAVSLNDFESMISNTDIFDEDILLVSLKKRNLLFLELAMKSGRYSYNV